MKLFNYTRAVEACVITRVDSSMKNTVLFSIGDSGKERVHSMSKHWSMDWEPKVGSWLVRIAPGVSICVRHDRFLREFREIAR